MYIKFLILTTIFALSSCSSPVAQSFRQTASETTPEVLPLKQTLPKLTSDNGELLVAIKKALKNRTKGKTDAELTASSEKIRDYLFFLGLTARDLKKAESAATSEDGVLPTTKPVDIKEKIVGENFG